MGGNHVRRQDVGQRGAQVLRVGSARVLADEVCDEPFVAWGVLASDDGGICDAGAGGQRRLDLAELDAEAADLDLCVDASEELEVAIRQPAGQIAGAVEAGGAGGIEGVGDEALGGEFGPVEISVCDAGASDPDLARDADRDGLSALVEEADVEVRDGSADHAAAAGLDVGARDGPVGDMHGGLGDAVHVDEAGPGIAVALDPGLERLQLQRLTAKDDLAQGVGGRGLVEVGLDELAEGGGGLVEDGDALVDEQLAERGGITADPVGDDDEAASIKERAPQLPDGEVEGVGVKEGPGVVRAEARTMDRLR